MNFLKDPQYNSIKIIVLLVLIVGTGYFVGANIYQRSNEAGRVINSDGGGTSSGSTPRSRPSSSQTSDNDTDTPPPKQQSTISTIVENIFGGSDTIQNTNIQQTKPKAPALVDQRTTDAVATVTTNSATIEGLEEGTYVFSVVARDASGNVSDESSSITVVIDGSTQGDTTDPIISSVSATPSQTSAIVTWSTDEAASSLVEYGLNTNSYTSTPETNTSPRVTTHTVTLSGLTAGTLYHYRVTSEDAANNSATSTDRTFATSSIPLPATPSITSSTPVSGSNNNSPKLFGTAPASSTVKIYTNSNCTGTIAATGTASSFASSGLTVSVSDNTTTNFYASATDISSNVSLCSSSFTYTESTPPPSDTTDPVITFVSVTPALTSAVIIWTTNEASSSKINYGVSDSYGSSTPETNTSPRVTTHTVTLSGLTQNTVYHFQMASKDAAGNEGVSNDRTFSTLAEQSNNLPPTIDLVGADEVSVTVDTAYVDPGATATDPEDGDLSDEILLSGNVNISEPDVYILTYSVEDSDGSSASVSREVTVVDEDEEVDSGSNNNSSSVPDDTTTPDDTTSPDVVVDDTSAPSAPSGGGDSSPSAPSVPVTVCAPYLSSYIEYGKANNASDVKKLQQFLNKTQDEALIEDGIYKLADVEAVNRFQLRYASSILTVWGLSQPTGYVGPTTSNTISSINCGGTATCPAFVNQHSLTLHNNESEVLKIKLVLQNLGFSIGTLSNLFDLPLYYGLVAFQEKFHQVMLDPWGLTEGTGYVGRTTLSYLNRLQGCDTGTVILPDGTTLDY